MRTINAGGLYRVKYVPHISSGAPESFDGKLCTVTKIVGLGDKAKCYVNCRGLMGFYLFPDELAEIRTDELDEFKIICMRLEEMKVCAR